MKVEVAVSNSPYGLCGRKATLNSLVRGQELCESRGGRPGLPVLNSPYGLCGHKATLKKKTNVAGDFAYTEPKESMS